MFDLLKLDILFLAFVVVMLGVYIAIKIFQNHQTKSH